MTDAEVMNYLRGHSTLNSARQIFSSWAARIDQSSRQQLSPIEMRRMEFEAVREIAEALGINDALAALNAPAQGSGE